MKIIISNLQENGKGSAMKKKSELKFFAYENPFSLSLIDLVKTVAIAALATLAAFLMKFVFLNSYSDQSIPLIYILAVAVTSSVTSGYLYGILSSVIGVIGVNFFFTAPFWKIDFTLEGYPLTFLIMLLISLLINVLTSRIKEQAVRASQREKKTETLYRMKQKLSDAGDMRQIADAALHDICCLFHCHGAVYVGDPKEKTTQLVLFGISKEDGLDAEENKRAAEVYRKRKSYQYSPEKGEGQNKFYFPLYINQHCHGVLCLYQDEMPILGKDNLVFLNMAVSQTASAMDFLYLSEQKKRLLIESEKEKMRSNLLRAVSHDLRTPLTCISGASSTLLENGEELERPQQKKLLTDIFEDCQWLIRMVENLLSVTRIMDGKATVKKSPEAVEEIVAEAVQRFKIRYPDQKLSVEVPDELLMIPMDGLLIEQVLINLMENSVKHSGKDSEIQIRVFQDGHEVFFQVKDFGEGVSKEEFDDLFSEHSQEDSRTDFSRGFGIGLSICMTIIKAHSGRLFAENHEEGGVIFTFVLPLNQNI